MIVQSSAFHKHLMHECHRLGVHKILITSSFHGSLKGNLFGGAQNDVVHR